MKKSQGEEERERERERENQVSQWDKRSMRMNQEDKEKQKKTEKQKVSKQCKSIECIYSTQLSKLNFGQLLIESSTHHLEGTAIDDVLRVIKTKGK